MYKKEEESQTKYHFRWLQLFRLSISFLRGLHEV